MSRRPLAAARLRHVTMPALGLSALVGAAVVAGSAGAQAPPSNYRPQLPDLTQDIPRQISVVTARANGRRVFRLAFRSAAENHPDASAGGGELLIVGRRSSVSKPMVADQYIDLFNPQTGLQDKQEVIRNVGTMRYVANGGHSHWHLKGFERYELRRASDFRLVSPDRKTGFCVGNRYVAKKRPGVPLPGAVPPPFRRGLVSPIARLTFRDIEGSCGEGEPNRLRVITGMNPTGGDDYKPYLEGQFIDVTKIRPGKYVLVHRVNPTRKLAEANYKNNASSVLLKISRARTGKPTIRVLLKCLGRERCVPRPRNATGS